MVTNRWFLGVEDITDALSIRKKVFIDEQSCPIEIERDAYDKGAMHVVLYAQDKPVGCGRIVVKDTCFKLGRIAVLKHARGKHYGDLILRLLLLKSFNMGAIKVRLGAQINAATFYQRFGFVAYGKNYIEANIEHVPMQVTKEQVKYPSDCNR